MSVRPAIDPAITEPSAPAIEAILDGRPRSIDGFQVRRLLPSRLRRLVGPFIFFDHMGPTGLSPAQGLDVRPHPHIGLATVTYLFEGEIIHRDSLGSMQPIRPGDINWMIAGRGVVHSERTSRELRDALATVHGLQLWVALPLAREEAEPEFHHYPGGSLPRLEHGAARVRVLAGSAYGVESPVRTMSPLFYLDITLPAGGELPLPREPEERAAYVVEGAVDCGPERAESGRMLVFAPGAEGSLRAVSDTRLVLLGGARLDGERHIWWNFVSSSKERIERAKRDWKEGRFAKVPGDELEFVPLPE